MKQISFIVQLHNIIMRVIYLYFYDYCYKSKFSMCVYIHWKLEVLEHSFQ